MPQSNRLGGSVDLLSYIKDVFSETKNVHGGVIPNSQSVGEASVYPG